MAPGVEGVDRLQAELPVGHSVLLIAPVVPRVDPVVSPVRSDMYPLPGLRFRR